MNRATPFSTSLVLLSLTLAVRPGFLAYGQIADSASSVQRSGGLPKARQGAKYFVRSLGDDALDGTTRSTAWRTLRRAAESVRAGDTVFVGAGTYDEQIVPAASGNQERGTIQFLADRTGRETGDSGDVILTCDHGPPVLLDFHFALEFVGFRFCCDDPHNELAAVQCIDSSVRFTDCEFTGWRDGVRSRQSQLVLEKCRLVRNLSFGLRADDYQLTMLDCDVTENRGGGVAIRCLPKRAEDQQDDKMHETGWEKIPERKFLLTHSRVEKNGGPGVRVDLADLGELELRNLESNRNRGAGCDVAQAKTIHITAGKFLDNEDTGVRIAKSGHATVARNVLRNNRDWGLALECRELQLRNCLVVENKQGVRFEGSPSAPASKLWNNTIAFNQGRYGLMIAGGDLEVVNTVLASNGEYGLHRFAGVLSHHHNLIWDHRENLHSTKLGPWEVIADPQFIDPRAGNYRLRRTSRAMNRGAEPEPTFAIDLEGQSRPLFRQTDMGCYESTDPPGVRFIHEWRELPGNAGNGSNADRR